MISMCTNFDHCCLLLIVVEGITLRVGTRVAGVSVAPSLLTSTGVHITRTAWFANCGSGDFITEGCRLKALVVVKLRPTIVSVVSVGDVIAVDLTETCCAAWSRATTTAAGPDGLLDVRLAVIAASSTSSCHFSYSSVLRLHSGGSQCLCTSPSMSSQS